MVGSWAGWCCPASVVFVVVIGGAEGGAFMLGALAMSPQCDNRLQLTLTDITVEEGLFCSPLVLYPIP